MIPQKHTRKHLKGQSDHLDAWLISYADLITLLFMLFVIFVSVSISKSSQPSTNTMGEAAQPHVEERTGTLALGTPYDEAYRVLAGLVSSKDADQNIAVEKSKRGVWIDMASARFFAPGTADLAKEQVPLLASIARIIKDNAAGDYVIEVEGHTDDELSEKSPYATNWELSAVRAARIASILIAQGVDAKHVRAVSYADMHPLVPNEDVAGNPIDQNRARNQRMIIRLEHPLESDAVN